MYKQKMICLHCFSFKGWEIREEKKEDLKMKIGKISILLTVIGLFVIVTQGMSKEVIIASGTSGAGALFCNSNSFTPQPGSEAQRGEVTINNINAPGRPINYRIRAWEQVQNTTCPSNFPATCYMVGNQVMDSGVVAIDGGETVVVELGEIVENMGVDFSILLIRVDWWVNQEGAIGRDVAALPLVVNFGERRIDSTGQTVGYFALQADMF